MQNFAIPYRGIGKNINTDIPPTPTCNCKLAKYNVYNTSTIEHIQSTQYIHVHKVTYKIPHLNLLLQMSMVGIPVETSHLKN